MSYLHSADIEALDKDELGALAINEVLYEAIKNDKWMKKSY